MDFSIIAQAPEIRQIVQENMLNRAFFDALFPRMLFRGESSPENWPGQVGDRQIFTGKGLLDVDLSPLVPGTDPVPATFSYEQWEGQLQQYAKTIDTAMPTSIVAIADLFLSNSHQLGLNAAQTMNRLAREKMYNASLSGQTVAVGAIVAPTTSLPVKRLNGFTRARRPDLTTGSPVRFDTVSASNPLVIKVAGVAGTFNVVGFTATTPGDEIGPGTLTLSGNINNVADRAAVTASDASSIVRVGGGDSVDAIGAGDLLTLVAIRSGVARFRTQNVPEMPDGRFHCHLDPISESQIFSDDEFQRLNTALPDYYMYKQFALGEIQGVVFFRDSECPTSDTVLTANKDGVTYTVKDPFAGELFAGGVATGVPIHRALLVAQGGLLEKYVDMSALITDAGVQGKVGTFSITNNGIDVLVDRVQLILRAPQNRLQDMVAASWKWIGDFIARTDAATGDAARYKRFTSIEHGA